MELEFPEDSFSYNTHYFSKNEIFEQDQLKIYQHYEPSMHMGMQKNPFYSDTRASLSLYERDGKVQWKDHGNGGVYKGDVVSFVQQWYLERKGKRLSFNDAIRAIHYDMKLEPGMVTSSLFFHDDATGHVRQKTKERTLIQVKDIGWTSWALAYWEERYNICEAILEQYHVGHAKEVWVTKPGKSTFLWGVSTQYNPIFYFYFPWSENIKIYAPLARGMKKWIGNANNQTDVQGYRQLHITQRRPEIVVFTKAMKEVLFLRSMGVDAIAGHGESHHFSDSFIAHIKAHSTLQFSLYDNDWAGRKGGLLLRDMHAIPIALIKEAKNITDLWEKKPQHMGKYVNLYNNFKATINGNDKR